MSRKQYIPQFFIFLFFCFAIYQTTFAQFSIGASYGIQIPGRQDLKFRFYENGELIHNIKTSYVKTDITPMNNIYALYWEDRIGLRLDYYEWEHFSTAKEFQTEERPPFYTVEQSRESLLLSLMYRFNFPFLSNRFSSRKSYFSYAGIGFGRALTDIDKGRNERRKSFQLFYGLSLPITSNLKLVGEFKFLLTQDADTLSNEDGWFVDTSGTPHLFRFGAHFDTKYHVIALGIQWDLTRKKNKLRSVLVMN